MKAKTILENMGFERKKSPEEIKSLFSGRTTYKQILDILCEQENFERIERFINDDIIDIIYSKYEKFDINDLKKAINVLINESIDNWYSSSEDLDDEE